MPINYAAIIDGSVVWAQQIMADYDALTLDDMRNRAAEQQAAHAMRMAQLEFECERALTMAAFCRVTRADLERWLQERGVITGR